MTDPTPTTSAETTTKSDFVSSKSAPSAERVRAAAVAYRAAQRAIDDDPEAVPDDDSRWESFMAASRGFTNAVGFGFACEAEDVADLLIAVLPDHPGAERVAALEADRLATPTATRCGHASESGGICVLREGHPEGRHRNGVDADWGLTHDTPDSAYVREWKFPAATTPTATAREGEPSE